MLVFPRDPEAAVRVGPKSQYGTELSPRSSSNFARETHLGLHVFHPLPYSRCNVPWLK